MVDNNTSTSVVIVVWHHGIACAWKAFADALEGCLLGSGGSPRVSIVSRKLM